MNPLHINGPVRRRFRMFRNHILAFFKEQRFSYTCNAKLDVHTCQRPIGHFGAHWCQCRSNDGTQW